MSPRLSSEKLANQPADDWNKKRLLLPTSIWDFKTLYFPLI